MPDNETHVRPSGEEAIRPGMIDCRRLSFDREYTPFAGHALERLEAPVAEAQSGTNHQVFHGTGH
jgi:hypothetical protein